MKKSLFCILRLLRALWVIGFLATVLACAAQDTSEEGPGDGQTAPLPDGLGADSGLVVHEVTRMPDDWVNKDPKLAQIKIPLPWDQLDSGENRGISEVIDSIGDAKALTNYLQIWIYRRANVAKGITAEAWKIDDFPGTVNPEGTIESGPDALPTSTRLLILSLKKRGKALILWC